MTYANIVLAEMKTKRIAEKKAKTGIGKEETKLN